MAKDDLCYENIMNEPAGRLLNLSDEELDSFIEVAKRAESEAHSIRHWLIGIRTEKAIRKRSKDRGRKNNRSHGSALSGILSAAPLEDAELHQLRCRAWQEQGLLIADPWDHRLTSSETRILQQIGFRLYVPGGEG